MIESIDRENSKVNGTVMTRPEALRQIADSFESLGKLLDEQKKWAKKFNEATEALAAMDAYQEPKKFSVGDWVRLLGQQVGKIVATNLASDHPYQVDYPGCKSSPIWETAASLEPWTEPAPATAFTGPHWDEDSESQGKFSSRQRDMDLCQKVASLEKKTIVAEPNKAQEPQIPALKQQIACCVEALRDVEWFKGRNPFKFCSSCRCAQQDGHDSNCRLLNVVTAAEELLRGPAQPRPSEGKEQP